jgi:hypothetical protein
MITSELKSKIVEAMLQRRTLFDGSDSKYATSLGISSAVYSRIKKGERDNILKNENWITLARKLDVGLSAATPWVTASTPVYEYITEQLEKCQELGQSALLCDNAGIGKTYTAKQYIKTHKNAVYIDCSQYKTRSQFLRAIAQEFGVKNSAILRDLVKDLVYYLKILPNPLIILDEAGDLEYEAFVEIKALWNATEGFAGWYMMGADGLSAKIRRAISYKRVGYTEIFDRFGSRFCKAIPVGSEEGLLMLQQTAAMIIKANAPAGTDINKVLKRTQGEDKVPSLRRIYKELTKPVA